SLSAVFRSQFGLALIGPDRPARFGGLLHRWLRSPSVWKRLAAGKEERLTIASVGFSEPRTGLDRGGVFLALDARRTISSASSANSTDHSRNCSISPGSIAVLNKSRHLLACSRR